jgi:hypothetical protein
VSPFQAWKALVFSDFSADEGSEDGCSIARCPRNAMYKARRHIAVVAAAMRTFEWASSKLALIRYSLLEPQQRHLFSRQQSCTGRVLMTVHGIEPVHRCNHYFIPNNAYVLAHLNQQLAALAIRIYPKAFVKTG